MIRLIAGETVVVKTPTTEYDVHMEPVVSWAQKTVGNVLVSPATTSDVEDSTRPDGTRAAFKLGFPKTFSDRLRGCRVVVRGAEYAVIGDPHPNTMENCPTQWWYTCEVEDVDG